MRYHIWTVGCQMNVADSERMAGALAAMGGTASEDIHGADVIVLNTCSVRQAAENRAMGKLSLLRNLKRKRPDTIVALAGCMVGDDSLPDLHKRLPFVDAFIRPADVQALCDTVRALSPDGSLWTPSERMAGAKPEEQEAVVSEQQLGAFKRPLRASAPVHGSSPIAWIPVIQGCNRTCSYCIVPARRGRERSRPVEEIVAEARGHVTLGAREVRLLGQIVDRYGQDLSTKVDLSDLFARLSDIEGLCRIRFLTSHPRDLTPRIINAIATEPKVCEDINIPIQAGDDAILKSMRRGYTVRYYKLLIDELRRKIPGLALSTDVIVGYPSETAEQFQRTLDILAETQFDVVHVAMFSPRPGTRASNVRDDVPAEEKALRLRRVEELQEEIASTINRGLLGTSVEILVESRRKGRWEGRTRTNKPVFFTEGSDWQGKLALVRVEHAGAWSLSGTVIGESA